MKIKLVTLYLILAGIVASSFLSILALQALLPDLHWNNMTLHSTVETTGAMAAIAMAVVLWKRKQEEDCGNFRLLAMGFLGMGLLEGFHAASQPGNGFILMRSVASLVGGIGFILVCVPESKLNGFGRLWIAWVIPVGSLVFGMWSLAFPERLPEMARNGEFTLTAVVFHLLAYVLLLAAAGRFLLDFHRSGKPEFYLFACLALMFSVAEFMFKYTTIWDVRWWWLHLLRLMTYLLVMGYVVKDYLQMQETLRESEHHLRQVLEEQDQMAQDLHDGIIQSIFTLALGLERCQRLVIRDPTEAMKKLGDSIAGLKGVIRDLRGYIIGLEPRIANGEELEAAMTSLVRSMEDSSSLHFRLQVDRMAANKLTPEEARHVLYIAREAMTNSLRHSGAQVGTVSLQMWNAQVRLEVEDDGVGFNPHGIQERGHGLRNIAARARRLGAQLKVVAEPGHGTRVVFEIPKKDVHAPA